MLLLLCYDNNVFQIFELFDFQADLNHRQILMTKRLNSNRQTQHRSAWSWPRNITSKTGWKLLPSSTSSWNSFCDLLNRSQVFSISCLTSPISSNKCTILYYHIQNEIYTKWHYTKIEIILIWTCGVLENYVHSGTVLIWLDKYDWWLLGPDLFGNSFNRQFSISIIFGVSKQFEQKHAQEIPW